MHIFLDPTDLTGDNFDVVVFETREARATHEVGEIVLLRQGSDLVGALEYARGYQDGAARVERKIGAVHPDKNAD